MPVEPMDDRRQNCTCWKRQQCTAGPPTSFLLPSIPLRTLSIVGIMSQCGRCERKSRQCDSCAAPSSRPVSAGFNYVSAFWKWMNEWMNKAVWEVLTSCLIAVLSHSDIHWSVPFRNICWYLPFRDCTIQRHMLIYLIQRMYHLETSAHLSYSEIVPFRNIRSSVLFRNCTIQKHLLIVPFRDCTIQKHPLICPIQRQSHSETSADLSQSETSADLSHSETVPFRDICWSLYYPLRGILERA